jgi:hypothetical protein
MHPSRHAGAEHRADIVHNERTLRLDAKTPLSAQKLPCERTPRSWITELIALMPSQMLGCRRPAVTSKIGWGGDGKNPRLQQLARDQR